MPHVRVSMPLVKLDTPMVPAEPASLRPAMEAYWHAVTALAGRLLGIAALSLGLPRDFFAARTDRHISMLRLICYPPYLREPAPGQLRAGVHTDLNMLTLVHADSDHGGLEVRARDGSWIETIGFGSGPSWNPTAVRPS